MKFTDPNIENYCIEHSTPISKIFHSLREETFAKTSAPQMQVGAIEGGFLKFLIRLSGAKTVLELGTFTGYSALMMAEALPEDGQLITCDIDPRATEIAKKYWEQSPHGKKIALKLGPALDTIQELTSTLDLVFIDADKNNYTNYWEACLPKVRQGGLIVVDNVLWSGRVLEPQEKSDFAIVEFNRHAHADARVDHLMLPIRDGMLLARKR
jgi:caffeoyl-CoA O-methyltransferase